MNLAEAYGLTEANREKGDIGQSACIGKGEGLHLAMQEVDDVRQDSGILVELCVIT